MNWYLKVLKHYADFNGRARRMEYWMFVLFHVIFLFIAMALDNLLGTTVSEMPYGFIYGLYSLALLIPGLAVAIRRLHDTGRSGWWVLIIFVPIIGSIWLLVLMVFEGDTGENKYGPDPKAATV